MNLVRFNPVRDMWRMRDDMDRLFNMFMSRPYDSEDVAEVDWAPSVDITENENGFLVKAELPGMNKDDIKITLQDNVLTIRGEKKEEKEIKDKSAHLCERKYGKFVRSFRLPSAVDNKKIDADFKDGVLNLNLPKAEEAKPKEIEIKMS